jgi:hypothetical protein
MCSSQSVQLLTHPSLAAPSLPTRFPPSPSQGNVVLTDSKYEVLTLLRSHRDDDKVSSCDRLWEQQGIWLRREWLGRPRVPADHPQPHQPHQAAPTTPTTPTFPTAPNCLNRPNHRQGLVIMARHPYPMAAMRLAHRVTAQQLAAAAPAAEDYRGACVCVGGGGFIQ